MTSELDKLLQKATNILADINVKDNRNAFDEAQNLIDRVRYALSFPRQQLGAWEAMELNAANSALEKGFLKLSIVLACRALEVSYLQGEEYHFGFEAVRNSQDQPIKKLMVIPALDTTSQAAARDLLWTQNSTAANLMHSQSSTAVHLFLTQRLAAESLVLVQTDAAKNLVIEDGHAASDLFQKQKIVTDTKNSEEAPHNGVLRQKDIESFMRTGDYSIDVDDEKNLNSIIDLDEEKEIALKLKAHQLCRASGLKEAQRHAASQLKGNEKDGANRLKAAQKNEAIILAETNVLRALLKKKESTIDAIDINKD